MSSFETQVKQGKRFQFGRNWQNYIKSLTSEKIKFAEIATSEMLGTNNLSGKTVLDIGSGSGLFSLVARRLGASTHSFDYDPSSVACTKELRLKYFPDDQNWTVEQGSILDNAYCSALGKFDIVYSWGVLHHTGDMWAAIDNAASLVKKGGTLFIAIYNDQGKISKLWKKVKEFYCLGPLGRTIVSIVFVPLFYLALAAMSIVNKKNLIFSYHKHNRGMAVLNDLFDWLGGLPFEVASVEEIFSFLYSKGFVLTKIKTTNGMGNNQFVFIKSDKY